MSLPSMEAIRVNTRQMALKAVVLMREMPRLLPGRLNGVRWILKQGLRSPIWYGRGAISIQENLGMPLGTTTKPRPKQICREEIQWRLKIDLLGQPSQVSMRITSMMDLEVRPLPTGSSNIVGPRMFEMMQLKMTNTNRVSSSIVFLMAPTRVSVRVRAPAMRAWMQKVPSFDSKRF